MYLVASFGFFFAGALLALLMRTLASHASSGSGVAGDNHISRRAEFVHGQVAGGLRRHLLPQPLLPTVGSVDPPCLYTRALPRPGPPRRRWKPGTGPGDPRRTLYVVEAVTTTHTRVHVNGSAHTAGSSGQGRGNMPQCRVRDAMTTDVVTAPDDASIAEIVAVLDLDDTVAAAPARPAVEHDPQLGRRIGRCPAWSPDVAPGGRITDHDVQTATRSAAPQ